ncbi:ABC transporter permease [Ferrovibrio sp.]|uniref:ABC transporter permease n=1 Tax=Ferrovibrio sp. TaxID=1917215 RepID=UPI003D2C49AC
MRKVTDFLLLALAVLALWQGMHWWAGDEALSSPAETVRFAVTLLGRSNFYPHLWESLRALGYSLLIASLGGLALGIMLGAHKPSGQVMEPVLVGLYALPKVTLYPLVLLLFGLGLPAKVAFGALHGIIPVTIFTLNAVRNIRPVYIRTAKTLRLDPFTAARTVLLPAALPEIVSGQRIGFSLTLLGVLLGEMFASQRGLGFLLMNAISINDVRMIMAIALILFAFAVTVSAGLLALDRRLHR